MSQDTSSAGSTINSVDTHQSSGLGALYDSRTQKFVKHYRLLREPTWSTLHRSINVHWWKIDKENGQPFSAMSNANQPDHQEELFSNFFIIQPDFERHRRLREFNFSQSIDTTTFFLLYSYRSRDQTFSSRPYLASLFFPPGTFDQEEVEATHIVHSMVLGIEILFTITIKSNQISNKDVICLLGKICSILEQKTFNSLQLTDEDQKIWSQLEVQIQGKPTKESSKLPTDIVAIILWIQRITTFYFTNEYPLEYVFQPVASIFQLTKDSKFEFNDDDDYRLSREVQLKLLELNNLYQTLVASKESIRISLSSPQVINEVTVEKMKENLSIFLEEVQCLSQDVRQRNKGISDLFNKLSSPSYNELCQTITQLQKECDAALNSSIKSENLTDEKQNNSLENEQSVSNLCDASLREAKSQTSSQELDSSISQNDNNTRLVDEAVSTSIETPSNERENDDLADEQPKPSLPSVKNINILLIGPSGVGKSTFINAFVNYLLFESIDDAKNGEPVALIPASFVITSGFNFDETVIHFGNADVNENYDHPGQSVTQDCRSYTFDISDKVRLRIIDTPGIGDTRGLEQDKKNINQILLSVSQFSHINAICILLNPNISRLEVFFRLCMLEIFSYLSADARNNIIFCFTNARSTFYAPGNTSPLLKNYLKTLSILDVPFGKKNTFSFDSESFRYLACVRQNFQFEEGEEDPYIASWQRSVPESIRLFKYIQSLRPYEIDRWQSKGHAKIQIRLLVRPIIESLRCLSMNQLLNKKKNNLSCVLTVKTFDDPNKTPAICLKCPVEHFTVENIPMVKYPTHYFNHRVPDVNQRCETCQCQFSDHELIDYEIDYHRGIPTTTTEFEKEIENFIDLIKKFCDFLQSTDLYLDYLNRFYNDKLSVEQSSLVERLKLELENLQLSSNDSNWNLDEIYEKIKETKTLPMIKVQFDAIKKRLELMQEQNETGIHIPKGASKTLSKLTEEN